MRKASKGFDKNLGFGIRHLTISVLSGVLIDARIRWVKSSRSHRNLADAKIMPIHSIIHDK